MRSFISFVLLSDRGRTKIYNVVSRSSGVPLGQVRWHSPWRRYIFAPAPSPGTIWSKECLEDVTTFIGQLMAGRRPAVEDTPVFHTALDLYRDLLDRGGPRELAETRNGGAGT